MTQTSTDLHADYKAAWKALPRRKRAELKQAAMKGQRSRTREDAALTLWWVQKDLRYGVRNTFLWAIAFVVGLIILAWVLSGQPPRDLGDLWRQNPMLPIFLLIPAASLPPRRSRLRVAARQNAAVLAGKTFNSPPDAEEAERLLRRAHKQARFRGTRPERS